MQLDPSQLSALAAVLRHGAFDLAAAELNVTPSAVSQRVKALEERVGTALVNRSAPCTATSAGRRLAKHAGDLGVLEAQVLEDLSLPKHPSNARLRLAVNADSLATWFVPALAAVSDMLYELVIDDQDHSAEWLARGEVSAAVTVSSKPARGCDRHALGSQRYIATASMDFVTRWFPDGVTADSLSRAPCLTFNAKDRLQTQWMNALTGERLTPPTHVLASTHAFIDAAHAGLGWGMNPEALVRNAIARGAMVPLLHDCPLDVPLDWQVSRAMSAALEPLTRAVRAAARGSLLR